MPIRDMDLTNQDTIAAEMQAIIRSAAEPWRAGDSVKAGILRSSRRLGISFRRARTFWYARSCAVRASEADRLRKIAAAIRLDQHRSNQAAARAAASDRQDELVTLSLRQRLDAARPILPLAQRSVAGAGGSSERSGGQNYRRLGLSGFANFCAGIGRL